LFWTQKDFPAVGQSLFETHCTQLPDDGSQVGVPPTQPASTAAQDTQVFWSEQKGTPASLLHWLVVLQPTQMPLKQ
jgi:hypothetical protein